MSTCRSGTWRVLSGVFAWEAETIYYHGRGGAGEMDGIGCTVDKVLSLDGWRLGIDRSDVTNGSSSGSDNCFGDNFGLGVCFCSHTDVFDESVT
jgi:hypothetical protein